MASPQLENGYLRIANELLDALGRINLNGTEFKVVLCVLRFTYGFNRKSHKLSTAFIARWCSCSVPTVKRAVKRLSDLGIIVSLNAESKGVTSELALEKNYDSWNTDVNFDTGINNDTGIRDDTGLVSTLIQEPVSTLIPKKRQYKNKLNILCASPAHESEPDENNEGTKLTRDKVDFEKIYAIYPKKRGKAKAFQYYRGFVNGGRLIDGTRYKLTPREIYLSVWGYVQEQEQNGTELQYFKNFDTFMNKAILDYLPEDGAGKEADCGS